jgi:hypothetical protein
MDWGTTLLGSMYHMAINKGDNLAVNWEQPSSPDVPEGHVWCGHSCNLHTANRNKLRTQWTETFRESGEDMFWEESLPFVLVGISVDPALDASGYGGPNINR